MATNGFFFNQNSTLSKVAGIHKDWAERLNTAVKEKANVRRAGSMTAWADSFRRLESVDAIDRQRIERVLSWYADHIRGKFVPLAFSADAFRRKFLQIESAMERMEGPQVTVSPTAKKLAAKLMANRSWPLATPEQLEKSVQTCLEVVDEFRAKLKDIKDRPSIYTHKLPNDHIGFQKCMATAVAVQRALPSTTGYVESWFIETHKKIANWTEYDGDLRRFEVMVSEPRFTKYGRHLVAQWCGDGSRFDALVKVLY